MCQQYHTGSLAFKNGMRKAKPILLEPVMGIELVTPEQFLGDLIGNINSMRGRIQSVESRGDMYVIHCHVPLAETFGYATRLRSITQGRATHTMEFYRYEEVPASVSEEITEKAAGVKNG